MVLISVISQRKKYARLFFQVPREDIVVSEVFAALCGRSEEIGITDWGLQQTSLEEVFLKIAQESEQAADPP